MHQRDRGHGRHRAAGWVHHRQKIVFQARVCGLQFDAPFAVGRILEIVGGARLWLGCRPLPVVIIIEHPKRLLAAAAHLAQVDGGGQQEAHEQLAIAIDHRGLIPTGVKRLPGRNRCSRAADRRFGEGVEQELGILAAVRRVGHPHPVIKHEIIPPGAVPILRTQIQQLPLKTADLGRVAAEAIHGLVVGGIVVGLGGVAQGVGVLRRILEMHHVCGVVLSQMLVEILDALRRAAGGIHGALAAVVGRGVGPGVREIFVGIIDHQGVVGDGAHVVIFVVIAEAVAAVHAAIHQQIRVFEQGEGVLIVVLMVGEMIASLEADVGGARIRVGRAIRPAGAQEQGSRPARIMRAGRGRGLGQVRLEPQEFLVGQKIIGAPVRLRGQIGLKLGGQGMIGEAIHQNQGHDAPVIGHGAAVALGVAGGEIGVILPPPLLGHARPVMQ